ncbi:SagB/ThcOx family dehydrogenase [Micromonospora echinospora]
MSLLNNAGGWVEHDELAQVAAAPGVDISDVNSAVEMLIKNELLISDDCDGRDILNLGEWESWGAEARHFHELTCDANYPGAAQERQVLAEAISSDGEPEPLFKEFPSAPTLRLPRVRTEVEMGLTEALKRRRTHRDFNGQPVPLDHFSMILAETWGPQRFVDANLFGTQQLRSSPSAGGRHEVECYVAALAVDGVPPGLYHYNADRHILELMDSEFDRNAVGRVTYGQRQCTGAAFTCFTTARIRRLSWKYRHPRAYRLVMYDAGHYGQTFSLIATALGLGPFQTAAFFDTALEKALGVSRNEEFPVYVLGAGYPQPAENSLLPSDYRYPRLVGSGSADGIIGEQPSPRASR